MSCVGWMLRDCIVMHEQEAYMFMFCVVGCCGIVTCMHVKKLSHQYSITSSGDGVSKRALDLLGSSVVLITNEGSLSIVESGNATHKGINIYCLWL